MKMRQVRAASPGRNDPDREMSESFSFKGPRERFPTCGEIGFYALSAAPAGCGCEVGSTHTITRLILDKAVSTCGFFGELWGSGSRGRGVQRKICSCR